MPQIKADGFSLTQLPKPSQTRTQVGGPSYNVAIFKFAAAAAKVGNYTFGPAECSLTLQIPVTTPRRRDPFDVFGFGGTIGPDLTSVGTLIEGLQWTTPI